MHTETGKYVLQKALKRKLLLVGNFIIMFLERTQFSIVEGLHGSTVVACMTPLVQSQVERKSPHGCSPEHILPVAEC